MTTTTKTCPAVLMMKGESFPCDWPTDEDGNHDGWNHANGDAEAIWSDAPAPAPQTEGSDRG